MNHTPVQRVNYLTDNTMNIRAYMMIQKGADRKKKEQTNHDHNNHGFEMFY